MSDGARALTEEGKCGITLGYKFVRQLEPLIVYHICVLFSMEPELPTARLASEQIERGRQLAVFPSLFAPNEQLIKSNSALSLHPIDPRVGVPR